MSSLSALLREYPGDEVWRDFIEIFRSTSLNLEDVSFYPAQCPEDEIAIVVTALLDENAEEWFVKPIGALDNRSAEDVLKNEPNGTQIIRHLLTRLPI